VVESARVNDREIILGRIREALEIRGASHAPASAPEHAGERPIDGALSALPSAGGATQTDWIESFRARSLELTTHFELYASAGSAHAALSKLAQEAGFRRVASHGGELCEAACAALGLPVLRTDLGYDKRELEACDAGITECDALVAQTGSVLVTSRSSGGRALSVLPPHHVVLARREQLVPDLHAAFKLVTARYAPDYPSLISLVTGPSRTGDIERILVLGAHGPKKLTILCR
jgi:L-lactate dehydrogenase complex protein LldG